MPIPPSEDSGPSTAEPGCAQAAKRGESESDLSQNDPLLCLIASRLSSAPLTSGASGSGQTAQSQQSARRLGVDVQAYVVPFQAGGVCVCVWARAALAPATCRCCL